MKSKTKFRESARNGKIPSGLEKFAKGLFSVEEEKASFIDSLTQGNAKRNAVLWTKSAHKNDYAEILIPPSGKELQFLSHLDFWNLITYEQSELKAKAYEEGLIYPLDLSSLILGSGFSNLPHSPRIVLDGCSAPGGKSLLAWKLYRPQKLVCNEVIGKRLGMLHSNLKRCGAENYYVTKNDLSILGEEMKGEADLVIIDAPCSGQSIFSKGLFQSGAFHPSTVNMNANRQKRIISCASSAVTGGGYIAYLTCTYAREENEKVVEWFLKRNTDFMSVPIPHLEDLRSLYSDNFCYRIFPFQGLGAGGFVSLMRRKE